MKTTITVYLFKLPKKNSEKNRLKIHSLENLINDMSCVYFEDCQDIQTFKIRVHNHPFAIRNFATVVEMMEYIFAKDDLEMLGETIK